MIYRTIPFESIQRECFELLISLVFSFPSSIPTKIMATSKAKPEKALKTSKISQGKIQTEKAQSRQGKMFTFERELQADKLNFYWFVPLLRVYFWNFNLSLPYWLLLLQLIYPTQLKMDDINRKRYRILVNNWILQGEKQTKSVLNDGKLDFNDLPHYWCALARIELKTKFSGTNKQRQQH